MPPPLHDISSSDESGDFDTDWLIFALNVLVKYGPKYGPIVLDKIKSMVRKPEQDVLQNTFPISSP